MSILHESQYAFFIVSRSILVIVEKVAEKIKTRTLLSMLFFFFENRAVYQIMWENMVQRDRPQMAM